MAERPAKHSAGRAPIVFLSYARADKAQAVRLAKALQGAFEQTQKYVAQAAARAGIKL